MGNPEKKSIHSSWMWRWLMVYSMELKEYLEREFQKGKIQNWMH